MFAVVLALLVGSCYGQLDQATFDAAIFSLFHSMDVNGNGLITGIEFYTDLNRYDTNGNGRVSRNEYTQSICASSPQLYNLSHYLYDEFDANNDHSLDNNDYATFFPKVDSNGDAMVDFAEYKVFAQKVYERKLASGIHSSNNGCH